MQENGAFGGDALRIWAAGENVLFNTMIIIKMPLRFGLRVKNIWLADRPTPGSALGFSVYNDCLETKRCAGFVRVPKQALFIDLRNGTEAVHKAMDSDLRYNIRRAEREGGTVELEHDATAFADMYDAFAKSKEDFPPMHRGRLGLYWSHMVVTKAIREGVTLGMHGYFINKQTRRATLLWAATLFREATTSRERNVLARFNLWHFWKDIELAAGHGCDDYDFGYFGDTTQGLESVNKFKMQFPCQLKSVSSYYSLPWFLWKRILDRNDPL
jgi:hypothetical protein